MRAFTRTSISTKSIVLATLLLCNTSTTVLGFSLRCEIRKQITFNNRVALYPRLMMSAVEETRTTNAPSNKNDTIASTPTPTNPNSARIEAILNKPKKSAPEKKRVEVGGAMIKISGDGIYEIDTPEEHAALIAGNQDKIILLKFFAPWCRACKGLAPKYIALAKDEKLKGLPLVFAEMSISNNKDFVKSLGVLALPSIQFYIGCEGVIENFPCGPSKVPILKKKLIALINERVDATTRQLKECEGARKEGEEMEPCRVRKFTVADYDLTEEQIRFLREDVPYFNEFTDVEFEDLMSKATLKSYDAGSVICRQGKPGNNFYIVETGSVEVSVRTGLEDPLTTPPSYIGAVINNLGKDQFFGERSLITGEPRAASIRAAEITRCFAFRRENIPKSSVLSGEKKATEERLAQIDEKYGADNDDYIGIIDRQLTSANVASQERGSVNNPQQILGVDVEEDQQTDPTRVREEVILPLLIRFKRVRRASKTFDYIAKTHPSFDDAAQIKRRSMLASKLPRTTTSEFNEVWNIIDKDNDGLLSLREMKEFMKSVGDEKCSDKIQDIITILKNPNAEMSYITFIGIMAEAEFYFLFTDMFNALDKYDAGYVRLKDLENVLSGMNDLVSDEKRDVFGFDDKDMLIDYELFSKMLLGAPNS